MPPDGDPPYFELRSDFQLFSFAYTFKILRYAPERDLSEIILTKTKKLRTMTGTFVLQRNYSFTLDS